MPDTPTTSGDRSNAPIVVISVSAALALAAFLILTALAGPPEDEAGAAPMPTSWATSDAPIFTTPAPEPSPLPTSDAEYAFAAALDNEALRGNDLGSLDDGRAICGLDGGEAPTVNDVVTAYHETFAEPPAELVELAIRHLCPKYVPLLAKGKAGFMDGTYTVGDDIKPGTYRTNKRITDCYWARSTGGGDIIANAFIENAPRGVTVTVHKGEGFTSEGCGNWIPA